MGQGLLQFGSGLMQGIGAGAQRMQEQQLLEMQKKLIKSQADIEQQRIDMLAAMPPELKAQAMFRINPLEQFRTKLLEQITGAAGIGPQANVPEQIAQGQVKQFDWPAPSAENVTNYALTGDTKDLVPPVRSVDMGNSVGFFRGTQMVGQVPKATQKEFLPVELPGGAKGVIPLDKYAPGPQGAIIPTAPQKGATNATEAVKDSTLLGAIQDAYEFSSNVLNPDGTVKEGIWKDLLNMQYQTPMTKGRGLQGLARTGLDVIARAKTGAAIRPDEWSFYESIYVPKALDSDQTKLEKITRFQRDLTGALQLLDPTGTVRQRAVQPKNLGAPKEAIPSKQPKRLTYDPETGTFK